MKKGPYETAAERHSQPSRMRTAITLVIGMAIGGGVNQLWSETKANTEEGNEKKVENSEKTIQKHPKDEIRSRTKSESNKTEGYGGREKLTEKDLRKQCEDLKDQDAETATENIVLAFCLDQKYRNAVKALVSDGYRGFSGKSVKKIGDKWEVSLVDKDGITEGLMLEEEPPCQPKKSKEELEAERERKELLEKFATIDEGVKNNSWEKVYDFDINQLRYEIRKGGLESSMGELVEDLSNLQSLVRAGMATEKEVNAFNCKFIAFESKSKSEIGIKEKIQDNEYLDDSLNLMGHAFAKILLKSNSFIIPGCEKKVRSLGESVSSESDEVKTTIEVE